MSIKTWGLVIDGSYRPASSGRTFAVENPADGSIVAEVAEGDGADIEEAVAANAEVGDLGIG